MFIVNSPLNLWMFYAKELECWSFVSMATGISIVPPSFARKDAHTKNRLQGYRTTSMIW